MVATLASTYIQFPWEQRLKLPGLVNGELAQWFVFIAIHWATVSTRPVRCRFGSGSSRQPHIIDLGRRNNRNVIELFDHIQSLQDLSHHDMILVQVRRGRR